MSGADDLRTAIIDALLDPPNHPGRGLADYSPDRASESTLADAVLAVLGDPVRRLALLELVGYDVVEEGIGLDRLPRLVVRPRVDATEPGRHAPFGVDDSNDIDAFHRGEDEFRERERGPS